MNSSIWLSTDVFFNNLGVDKDIAFIAAFLLCLVILGAFFSISIASGGLGNRSKLSEDDFEPITPNNRYSHKLASDDKYVLNSRYGKLGGSKDQLENDLDEIFSDYDPPLTLRVRPSEYDYGMCATCGRENVQLFHPPCGEKPELLINTPVGMYHCPDCGTMLLAGYPHPRMCKVCVECVCEDAEK